MVFDILHPICYWSSVAAKTVATHWGLEPTRFLNAPCNIWHQDISSRSFKSLGCQVEMTRAEHFGPAHLNAQIQ